MSQCIRSGRLQVPDIDDKQDTGKENDGASWKIPAGSCLTNLGKGLWKFLTSWKNQYKTSMYRPLLLGMGWESYRCQATAWQLNWELMPSHLCFSNAMLPSV